MVFVSDKQETSSVKMTQKRNPCHKVCFFVNPIKVDVVLNLSDFKRMELY